MTAEAVGVDDPADPDVEPDDRELLDALPGYEVGPPLGRGAMGEVIGGRHVRLDRPVAIKRLPRAFAGDPDVRARFADEAKVLASLAHPHVVPVYDYLEREGLCLLVMQSLPGGTVWDRFTSDGVSMPQACAIVVAACAGLQHAHERRVLHRDVKPDNLMFDEDNTLKVTDFGIATALSGTDTLATLDGQVLGTPAYMAPEQANGRPVGPQADVYAAGTMLYELLSGRLPFSEEGGVVELLRRRVEEEPEPLDDVAPAVPAALVAVVMRAIARDPDDRFPTAEELGVAVADAAAAAWGPGWLDAADLNLMAGGALGAAGRTTTMEQGAPSHPDGQQVREARTTGAPEVGSTDTSHATGAPSPPARPTVDRDGRPTWSPSQEVGSLTPKVVRATVSRRQQAGDLADVDPAELVRVADVLEPPEIPRRGLLATAAIVALTLLVAVVGLGSPDREQAALDPGDVVVDGVDLADGGGVETDLGTPVLVEVDPSLGATRARLVTSAMGLPAGTSSTEVLEPTDGARVGPVFTRSLRVVSSGELTARLELLDDDGAIVLRHDFLLEPDRAPWLSATGLAAALLLVFAAAYVASVTQPLRLGRRQRGAYVGMGLLGAVTGLAVQLGSWSMGAPEPTAVSTFFVIVLTIAAFVVGGWCLFRLGRRRRLRALHDADGSATS